MGSILYVLTAVQVRMSATIYNKGEINMDSDILKEKIGEMESSITDIKEESFSTVDEQLPRIHAIEAELAPLQLELRRAVFDDAIGGDRAVWNGYLSLVTTKTLPTDFPIEKMGAIPELLKSIDATKGDIDGELQNITAARDVIRGNEETIKKLRAENELEQKSLESSVSAGFLLAPLAMRLQEPAIVMALLNETPVAKKGVRTGKAIVDPAKYPQHEALMANIDIDRVREAVGVVGASNAAIARYIAEKFMNLTPEDAQAMGVAHPAGNKIYTLRNRLNNQ